MSIFSDHKTVADRSATDRRRHKKKIEKAIREGVHHIVSNESIIGQDGKKKIKIPVRGVKEYRFVYGDNDTNKSVGSAPGRKIRRGQKIGSGKNQKQKQGDKPGNEPGEEIYEVEISLEELAHYLFDSLNLPDLEKKKLREMISEKTKRKGYRSKGIRPRLDKKESLKNKIKRKKLSIKTGTYNPQDGERFPFHENDLKYKHIDIKKKENSNAVIFFIMDVSGSMGKQKKFMARSFFFLLYHFLRYKYEKVDIVFIAHTTHAKEVSEDDFFKRSNSGGTYLSSGLNECIDIINQRYHPHSWNIYTFHCSDGENWSADNPKAKEASLNLKAVCQLYGYIQIIPGGSSFEGEMAEEYAPMADNKFKVVKIYNSEDIWPEFQKMFGGNLE